MKQKDTSFSFRGKFFFWGILGLYGLMFCVNSHSALMALQKSATILTKILPILGMVILFTTLLNYLLKPKQIAAHLGRESGIKGWFWALAAGVISHGPMYVWYPLLEDLREHGMKDELVVVFFASRAIKIPLLPMMVDYFGITFTIILSFYMLIGALLQGGCLQFLENRKKRA
jgi:uncharacterized membrane protein YraQ (UPF0718 family)